MEVGPVMRGDNPADEGPVHGAPAHVSRHHAGRKQGDVQLERQVNQRIRELGLMDNKLLMERQLATRLDESLEKGDTIVGALKRCRRRSRPTEQLSAFSGEVKNIIRQDVLRDANGNKVTYAVNVLMGRFTKDVKYLVDDKEVIITGTCPNGPKLSKEIRIEFPEVVDFSRLIVSYSAGVFKMQVPYRSRPESCRRMSITSDPDASGSWTSESTSNEQEGPTA